VADALIRKYIAALVANRPDEAANATKAMVDYVYTAPQPKAEQEPVGTYEEVMQTMRSLQTGTLEQQQAFALLKDKPLYAEPQPRRRLTDEEIDAIYIDHRGDGGPTAMCEQFARAIEAAIWSKT
jgi:hypothetical protein